VRRESAFADELADLGSEDRRRDLLLAGKNAGHPSTFAIVQVHAEHVGDELRIALANELRALSEDVSREEQHELVALFSDERFDSLTNLGFAAEDRVVAGDLLCNEIKANL